METFDLRKPQKTLGQWPVPKQIFATHTPTALTIAQLERLLSNTKTVRNSALWPSSTRALEAFAQACKLKPQTLRIASWKPSSIQLEHEQRLVEIPRDPVDWQAEHFTNCDMVLIQNPSLWDGYFLPKDLLTSAIENLHKILPAMPLLIDQRNLVFSWEDLAPEDLSDIHIANPHAILGSTHPVLSPGLATEIAWTHSNLAMPGEASLLSNQALVESLFLISSFKTKQGPYAHEFQKVMLVVRESLKRISSDLQLMSKEMGFAINYWPTCGSFLTLQCGNPKTAQNLIKRFETHGVTLNSGGHFGDPNAVMLSYSMHLSQCDRLLKRFQQIRNSPSAPTLVL